MRLFAAVLPPEEVLDELDAFLEPRRDAAGADSPLRWTRPGGWHLTLAFMASVPEWSLDELEERLAAAAARRDPFTLSLRGGGAFPDVTRAALVYAGVAGEPEALTELERLATGARSAAAKAGAAPDGAAFRPHLTLARTRRPVEATRWLRVLDTFAGRPFAVTSLALVQSFLGEGPGGRPRYEVLGTLPLGRT